MSDCQTVAKRVLELGRGRSSAGSALACRWLLSLPFVITAGKNARDMNALCSTVYVYICVFSDYFAQDP